MPEPRELVLSRVPSARCYCDAPSGGRWVVSQWDSTLGIPVGLAIGRGATPCEAWQDAADRVNPTAPEVAHA